MAEKKSHLPHEVAFGGAIPKALADEFKKLVADAGWSHKRALAAAIMVFMREAKSQERIEDTQVVRWYGEVGAYSRGEEPTGKHVSFGGTSGELLERDRRAEQLRIRASKALREVRDSSPKSTGKAP